MQAAIEDFQGQEEVRNAKRKVVFLVHRIPFFLEPDYMHEPEDFTESHDTRMTRKFGSKERFEAVKRSHGLIPRGKEVGLDETCGYTEENLSKRIQSSTLRSQQLVYFVAREFGLDKCEELYSVLNRRHFTEAGILNDPTLLLESCDEVGIDRDRCKDFLFSSPELYKKEVLDMYEAVLSQGIHSIPTTVVDGRFLLSGAARSSEILQIFNKIFLEKERATSGRTMFTL